MSRTCACGCGESVGRKARYVLGHQLKGKSPHNKGRNPGRFDSRLCACGCGQQVTGWSYHRGAPKRFISGHNSRLPGACKPPTRRGADHPNFRNGLTVQKRDGRLLVALPDSRRIPHAHLVAETLLLRRRLREDEVVHHKDGNPANDATANLVVLTRAEHARLHDPRGWASNGA